MRVLVLGSSVALSIRPTRSDRTEGNYSDLLREELQKQDPSNEVINLAQGSTVITDMKDWQYIDILKRHNPDVVILNYGINEAAPRLISLDFWRWLFRSKNRGWFRNMFAKYIYKWAPFLIRTLKLKGWVSADKFVQQLKALLVQADKESKSKVIVLNVGPANDHFMKMLPGVETYIPQYNDAIGRALTGQDHAVLLDIFEQVELHGIEKIQPDGCHFSALGHKIICEKILKIIHAFCQ